MANIEIFKKFGVSSVASNVTYSASLNVFTGNGYTSAAGNNYFNAFRFAEGILIKEDVGVGYVHTFLNGIRIFDLSSKTLLCERSYHCCYYDKNYVKSQSIDMLCKLVMDAAKSDNVHLLETDVQNHVSRIVNDAFITNQMEMMNKQLKVLK
jgi:hypothetical protein